jgi:methionyl-tRNA formyltransferase
VTYAPELQKEDSRLDWTESAQALDRRVRAVTPWPGAFTFLHGQRLKIVRAAPLTQWRGDAPPGVVVALADGYAVATGAGALRLEEVQLAGKRVMDIGTFLCGQRDCVGSCLGLPAGEDDGERN